ncbi:hypothetical protein CHLRE_15g638100v5 [Chlamydomonas reinhardtii]|uniref:RAP domain-containing protein n=1 Tax=Chlamydomonas reinhardtii TaxID=3055 RepID=A0A2K3CWU1_CHLRE|nr:uncharacterized protein CHLRE_15g638100v5 [Chlamydomonas reinhardtii]PNW72745.1 hypothetical protein CHLRE_15g638100v5 [Chlamydomonas reinhardtii]
MRHTADPASRRRAPPPLGAGGGLRQLLPLAAWARQAAPAPATGAPAAAGARSCRLQPGRRAQQQVLAAAGRYGSGSRSSSDGGGRAGRGRAGGGGGGRARDPADDMTVCRTLDELQVVIDQRLAVWCERQDVMTMSAAFNLCGKLESSHAGPAATAAARAGIMAALAPALLPLVPRIRQPASCSIPLWALAKAGAASDGRVESQLAPALLQRLVNPVLLGMAKPQELSNALYALGKLREDQQQRGSGWDPTSSPHLIALAGAVASRLRGALGHGFEPQHVSNTLWACAKLGYRDSYLLLPLAEATAALARDMNAQDVANNLWALEVLGCTGPEFRAVLEALCGAALRRFQTPKETAAFKPQGLSNILLALEGLQLGGTQSEQLAAAVAVEAMRRGFAGCNPQELSNSAWALAKMGYGAGATSQAMKQSPWYAAVAAAAQRPGVMAGAKPQAWANLLYALALVRHQPPPALLDAGAVAAMQRGNAQDCANTLWALAVLQLRHAGLEAAVCGRLGELLRLGPESLAEQNLCNSLWALAVLAGGGGPATPAAAALAPALAREAVRWREELNGDGLRQLWQARQQLGGEVAEALARSPDLLAAMEAAVAAERATGLNTSRTQEQVAEALRRLLQKGRLPIVLVQTEVVAEGVLGRVDIVADWSDGRRLAIEVDGPDHFLTNRKDDPSAVIGSTALRNRQLRRAFGEGGLVCVPYWEWDERQTPSFQEAYLLQRLQDLLSGAPSGAAAGGEGSAAAPRRKQQRTTQPQPDTAGTTTTATTTAVSSQTRRILVVRRKAPKQDLQHDATCDAPSASGAGPAEAVAEVATSGGPRPAAAGADVAWAPGQQQQQRQRQLQQPSRPEPEAVAAAVGRRRRPAAKDPQPQQQQTRPPPQNTRKRAAASNAHAAAAAA